MRANDPNAIEVGGPPSLEHPAEDVVRILSPVVTEARLRRIEAVVAGRTDALTVVLDCVSDPHNASAVLRSADAFGVQQLNAIIGDQDFKASRGVSKGTHRWVDVTRYGSAEACMVALKSQGFDIYVASMEAEETPDTLPVQRPVAVVFGNEHRGVSPETRGHADGTFAIPMRGFVESLNVSVAAAITLRTLSQRISQPLNGARELELKARFLMNSVNNAVEIIEERLAGV